MDFTKMADEIINIMGNIKQMVKAFNDAGCEVEYDNAKCLFVVTPPKEVITPGVMADINWLKARKVDYPRYEAMFHDSDMEVTEYSTWGNPFMSNKGIGIWRAADKGDVDFSLVFKENKTYPIAQHYNPDMFGDSPNEAYISDEYGVIHRVIRA